MSVCVSLYVSYGDDGVLIFSFFYVSYVFYVFYDVFLLPNGRLGILIADVADKGMASALYMALSRTLIRTYAAEYDTQPELVLTAANHRILMDTRADLFVTVFYGILDPATGTLVYCNAGHNPPYLFGAQNSPQQPTQNGDAVKSLRRTGMALGVLEESIWQQQTTQIDPGDVLVLYTDGITDAQKNAAILQLQDRGILVDKDFV